MKGLRLGCTQAAVEKNKPYIAIMIIQLVYAGLALFSKAAISQGMNSYVFVVYRQAFASLALAPFAIFLDRKTAPPLSYNLLWKIFLTSLFGICLSLNLYYLAMKYTSATFAAATTNTIPAITFILAALFRMERISIREWDGVGKMLGSVVGVSGAFVFAFVKGPPIIMFCNNNNNNNNWKKNPQISEKEIISHHHPCVKSSLNGEWVKGSLIMLSANSVWSMWLIMQASIVKKYPAKIRLATLQCIFSCMQSAVLAMVMERDIETWKLGWDANLLSVTYCGVIVTGITYWLQIWVIEKSGPVFTAMFTPLALIITAIFSALFWKEVFHLGSACGAVLLVGGLYVVLWGKKKETKRTTTAVAAAVAHHHEVIKPDETMEEIKLECITHQQ